MIGLFLALQAAPLADMKTTMQPISIEQGAALFKRICFDPFPDPKAALGIIAEPALGLTKSPKTPTQAMQPGDEWTSNMVRVTYVDADWMPRDLGSPQCSVTVALEGNPAHGEIANAVVVALGLPVVKFGKDGPRAQTQWNLPGRDPDKWRLFLTTEATPSGVEMRAVIMNLRGKKK